MTKVLLIKTSSMGDLIHTLPAIMDAAKNIPNVMFDWVVEEAFAEIPSWHPRVQTVIPVAWRRLRKQPLQLFRSKELLTFFRLLREQHYDYVIDAQGLLKSAIITRFARGSRWGLDWHSAWEPLASLAYQNKITVDPNLHAVTRMRKLVSSALSYPFVDSAPDYGLHFEVGPTANKPKSLLFVHGTTWDTKEWPEQYWMQLASIAIKNQFNVFLPWGNAREQQRAIRIQAAVPNVSILPRTSLTDLAKHLVATTAVVSVDTGIGHLAAALNIPTVSLYGPTDPKEVGTQGQRQQHLAVDFACAPCKKNNCQYKEMSSVTPACFETILPEKVWKTVTEVIKD